METLITPHDPLSCEPTCCNGAGIEKDAYQANLDADEARSYTPLSAMTVEDLGINADENDLSLYIEAVQNVMGSTEFDRDEPGASAYVWNEGDIRFYAGCCSYCERVLEDATFMPQGDEEWAAEVPNHTADCEWLATRAHTDWVARP